MEGKRPGIFFLLLVTLSSVMGRDFTFSKEAYDAIMATEHDRGFSFVDVQGIKFLNTKNNEEFLVESDDEGDIFLVPKDPKAVTTAISGIKNQGQEPAILSHISIIFGEISHQTKETTCGYLLICFQDKEKEIPDESCVMTYMFSSPQKPEDEKYAEEIAKKINPLSETEVQSISKKQPFKWALSSLEEVLSGGLKAVVSKSDSQSSENQKEENVFLLKPIIVDEKLLKEYFDLATPQDPVK